MIVMNGTKNHATIAKDIAPTLTAEPKETPIVAYSEKRYFEYHEDTLSVSIRAKSGSYGGEVNV